MEGKGDPEFPPLVRHNSVGTHARLVAEAAEAAKAAAAATPVDEEEADPSVLQRASSMRKRRRRRASIAKMMGKGDEDEETFETPVERADRLRLMNLKHINALFEKFSDGDDVLDSSKVKAALAELGHDVSDFRLSSADGVRMTRVQFEELVISQMLDIDDRVLNTVHRKMLVTMHSSGEIRDILMTEMTQVGVIVALMCGTGLSALTGGFADFQELARPVWHASYGNLVFLGTLFCFVSLITSTALFAELNALPPELAKEFALRRLSVIVTPIYSGFLGLVLMFIGFGVFMANAFGGLVSHAVTGAGLCSCFIYSAWMWFSTRKVVKDVALTPEALLIMGHRAAAVKKASSHVHDEDAAGGGAGGGGGGARVGDLGLDADPMRGSLHTDEALEVLQESFERTRGDAARPPGPARAGLLTRRFRRMVTGDESRRVRDYMFTPVAVLQPQAAALTAGAQAPGNGSRRSRAADSGSAAGGAGAGDGQLAMLEQRTAL